MTTALAVCSRLPDLSDLSDDLAFATLIGGAGERDPLDDDQDLAEALRRHAAALGQLFSVDKALMRAAIVAALPAEGRRRAMRALGADPMLVRDEGNPLPACRASAAEAVLEGARDLVELAHQPLCDSGPRCAPARPPLRPPATLRRRDAENDATLHKPR